MRKILNITILLVLGLTFCIRGVFASESRVEVTLSESYVSRYIWRGQDLYPDNDPAQQPSLDILFKDIFYDTDLSLNIWGSFALGSAHEDAEELDYTLTLSREFLDYFSVSLGETYFDYPNTTSRADIAETWGSLTLNRIPFLPIDVSATLFAGYDFQAKSGGPDEGWYYSFGFDTELPLPEAGFLQEDQAFAIGVVNWGNDGVADLKPTFVYATDIYVSTAYVFNNFTLTPSVHYVINHEEAINNGNDEVWFGINVGYMF